MTVFETLASASTVDRRSMDSYIILPFLSGVEGQKIEEVRAELRKKRSIEMGLWQKVTAIYTPSE